MLPVLSLVGIAILILSRRSPLIAHPRMGQGGRPIWVLKLRTMWDRHSVHNSISLAFVEHLTLDVTGPAHIKEPIDPRVTSRFAALCRRYSIDEFPQLWHVVRGEMALLGPRPLTAAEVETHYGSAARRIASE